MSYTVKQDMTNKFKVYTEGTPNPNALKFVCDQTILENGTANFPNKESAVNSPLAKKLFDIDSVKEVFIGKDFITISKASDVIWEKIYDAVMKVINNHFESGEAVILEQEQKAKEQGAAGTVEDRIREILDSQIRPAVAGDGGDVIFDSYSDGILKLRLQGACSSCPSAIMTLKVGIEQMLKRHIPELKEVVSV